MNCAQHPEFDATAFCRECGKPMCSECQRPALGSVYCEAHLPATPPAPAQPLAPYAPAPYTAYATPLAASPYTAPANAPPADPSVHPVLALLLGFIPGVGAIYNGQYAKGLVHAVVFALLVSAEASGHNAGMEAFIGIMIAAWVFYMVFEAYHTARKRRYGVAVEEFSGQFDFRTGNSRVPVGAILLIGLGFILLLDTTDIISIEEFGKYWPVGMILLGVYLLYNRLNPDHSHINRGKDAEAPR
jgi:cell wall-active antibiotic response 4TMS protein YvqF/B-box zinc finger protein